MGKSVLHKVGGCGVGLFNGVLAQGTLVSHWWEELENSLFCIHTVDICALLSRTQDACVAWNHFFHFLQSGTVTIIILSSGGVKFVGRANRRI